MSQYDAEMEKRAADAAENGEVLRYVAVMDGKTSKCRVELRNYLRSHPFAHLEVLGLDVVSVAALKPMRHKPVEADRQGFSVWCLAGKRQHHHVHDAEVLGPAADHPWTRGRSRGHSRGCFRRYIEACRVSRKTDMSYSTSIEDLCRAVAFLRVRLNFA